MKRFMNWLTNKTSSKKASTAPVLRPSGSRHEPLLHAPKPAIPKRQSGYSDISAPAEERVDDDAQPEKVLIRNKYVREDTGTHETLKILDDSLLDAEEEGLDPYNSGRFDRSKNWGTRFK
jgi:hypothetical protein